MNATVTIAARHLTTALFVSTALIVTAWAGNASAHGIIAPTSHVYRGPCTYSLQLQKSVEAQRRYLVQRDEATGASKGAHGSTEEGIKVAARTADDKGGSTPQAVGDLEAFLGF